MTFCVMGRADTGERSSRDRHRSTVKSQMPELIAIQIRNMRIITDPEKMAKAELLLCFTLSATFGFFLGLAGWSTTIEH
jgi:hypothetical protein